MSSYFKVIKRVLIGQWMGSVQLMIKFATTMGLFILVLQSVKNAVCIQLLWQEHCGSVFQYFIRPAIYSLLAIYFDDCWSN